MRSRTKTVALRPGYQNFQVAQLNTNSPEGAGAMEKHHWDARGSLVIFPHEMDHARKN